MTTTNTIKTDLIAKHRGGGWISITNNGPSKAFYFLEACRKAGHTSRVGFGAPYAESAIRVTELNAFLERVKASGLTLATENGTVWA